MLLYKNQNKNPLPSPATGRGTTLGLIHPPLHPLHSYVRTYGTGTDTDITPYTYTIPDSGRCIPWIPWKRTTSYADRRIIDSPNTRSTGTGGTSSCGSSVTSQMQPASAPTLVCVLVCSVASDASIGETVSDKSRKGMAVLRYGSGYAPATNNFG